jgi:hypothetical protein
LAQECELREPNLFCHEIVLSGLYQRTTCYTESPCRR